MALVAMIVIIATPVIIVTLTGRIKKRHLELLFCNILFVIMLLLFSFWDASSIKFSDVLSVGLLIVAFVSLIVQQRNLIKQIRLNVFSDSMSLLMADEKFSESQEYIFSRKYDETLTIVQQALNKTSQDDIGLDDFRRILHQNRKDDEIIDVDPDTRGLLRVSYNKIRYIFSRMEYLGVLAGERGVETLILEYYGYTIISIYERLLPIIEKTRKEPNNNVLYIHFSKLYNLAIGSKKHNNQ